MKIIETILSWKAKKDLIWQQKKNIATFMILENYITDAVLNGEKLKGPHLIDVQNKLNEAQKFLKFLTRK